MFIFLLPPVLTEQKTKKFSKILPRSLSSPPPPKARVADQPGVIEGALRKAYLLCFFAINGETEGERREGIFLRKQKEREEERERKEEKG